MTTAAQVEEWRPDLPGAPSLKQDIDMLGEVLHAVVHTGAGVSFIVPFSIAEARTFWVDQVLPGVRDRTRRVLVARWDTRIVGTVQIDLAVPPNQQHRAEVLKLLVHPEARRHGIARALMTELESIAQDEGRTLLTLDTWTGGNAESLYRSMGYIAAGVIPRYARGSLTPELEPTTIMYKELSRPAALATPHRTLSLARRGQGEVEGWRGEASSAANDLDSRRASARRGR
ncbi:MAG: GNAT family N-acetyltransferase [Dehalococcoidia bacterium]